MDSEFDDSLPPVMDDTVVGRDTKRIGRARPGYIVGWGSALLHLGDQLG